MYCSELNLSPDPFGDGSLIAWWPLCENLEDATGHNVLLANTDGRLRPDIKGLRPGAKTLYFDGNRVVNYTPSALMPTGTSPFTLSYWFWSDFRKGPQGNWIDNEILEVVFSYGKDDNTTGHRFASYVSESYVCFDICCAVAAAKMPTGSLRGRWVHATLVFTGATGNLQDAQIYVDGVQQPNVYPAGGPSSSIDIIREYLCFGSLGNTTVEFFYKNFNMRYFNRALTAAEVAQLYNEVPQDYLHHRQPKTHGVPARRVL